MIPTFLPWRIVMATVALACARSTAAQRFVNSTPAELVQLLPELSALAFDNDQSKLSPLLKVTGEQLEGMLTRLPDISMTEEIHEMRFDNAHLVWKEHHDKFRYVVSTRPFAESRRQAGDTDAPPPTTRSAFLIAGPFVGMLGDLLLENQKQMSFRYLGRLADSGGRASLVLAFLERNENREGLVWVDEPTKRILRVRTATLGKSNGGSLDSFVRDVRYVPVSFPALATMSWLPASAVIHARIPGGELHSVHRFSAFRTEKDGGAGETLMPLGIPNDAVEVLMSGVAAIEARKPGDAVTSLRESAARLPERIEPLYYLGLAMYETGDWPGAEIQFRETVKRAPKFAAAHEGLSAALAKLGNQPAAVAELEEALRLDPGNAKIHANLDAMTGKAAASAAATSPSAAETTIKVDVRQVLVPVVVTDRQGNHVTGLTQADFRIFEDGVEQKIAAFSTERPEFAKPASAGDAPSRPGAAAENVPAPMPARHTYVICLDMFHTSFANFAYIREALEKLFHQEQAGDSRYVVIALGRSLEVIQAPTSDPAQVLETLSGSKFHRLFGRGMKSVEQSEISSFEDALSRTRDACDAHEPACAIEKTSLPSQARALEQHERIQTTDFLKQLRFVVGQLAGDSGRRTLVLISDGVLLAPGRIPFGLLEAYFPEFRSTEKLISMHDVMDPIFKLAVKANIAIYTIDSRGLYAPSGTDASRSVAVSVITQVNREWDDIAVDQGLTLSEIAAATGGTSFKNTNDLITGLQRAFADGREYYSLAYVSNNEAQDGKFRKIEVRVRDTKAVVKAKRGYWATEK